MIKENTTKMYSVYSPTINWGDVLYRHCINMYFTKFNNLLFYITMEFLQI